ncbi:MAG: acyloxyacyl hydrolase [Bacteroidia bacterium]|nr:acyloxyacyl hydrolase [Bacteroidia bacterium]
MKFGVRRNLFFLCFYLVKFLPAQDSLNYKNSFTPELNTYFGYLIKAYPGVPQSNYVSLNSVGFYWQTNGKDAWHQHFLFPKFGFDFMYGSFNNQQELGYSLSISPCWEFKSKKANKKWRFKTGFGAAYFNKPFNAVTNPTNFYIGGNYTNMTVFNLFWKHTIKRGIHLKYGLAAIHSSNGHTSLPNAGMNMVSAHIGLSFLNKNAVQKSRVDSINKKLSYTLKAGIGYHEFGSTSKPVGGPLYPSYHISLWLNKPYSKIGLLQFGFTGAYYTSFYDYIVSQEVYATNQKIKSSTGLLFAGHELVFGKLSFVAQAGIYFYNPFYIKQKKLEGSWDNIPDKLEAFNTNRIGLMYYPFKKSNSLVNLKNQFHLGLFLKANLAQADLFEYSLGFTF